MFKKLLCAIALASVAFAQGFTLVLPEGTTLKAGAKVNILLSSNADVTQDLGIVVAASACFDGDCPDPKSNGLGVSLYTGQFQDNRNITVDAPNWFNGAGVLSIGHFYTSGVHNVAMVDIASTKITLSATG